MASSVLPTPGGALDQHRLAEPAGEEGDERGRLIGEIADLAEPLAGRSIVWNSSLIAAKDTFAALFAAWFAQIDLPSLDQSAPEGLRSLLDVSFLLTPIGSPVGVVGHMIGMRTVVGIGIALAMLGTDGLRGGDRRLRLGAAGGSRPRMTRDSSSWTPGSSRPRRPRSSARPRSSGPSGPRRGRDVGVEPRSASVSSVACSPQTVECTSSSVPPGRRWAALAQMRSSSARPSRPALPRAGRRRALGIRRSAGNTGVGDDQSKRRRRPARADRRAGRGRDAVEAGVEPRVSDRAARHVDGRHRAGAVRARRRRRAAPLPVQTSSTSAPARSSRAQAVGQQPGCRCAGGRRRGMVHRARTATWCPARRPRSPQKDVSMSAPSAPRRSRLRAAFDAVEPLTIGLEEEVMLLDPETLELAPSGRRRCSSASTATRASSASCRRRRSSCVTAPRPTSPARSRELAAARSALLERRRGPGPARPPPACIRSRRRRASSTTAPATTAPRASTRAIARRQLVCALQVHVAVGGAERALAVHNALRSYLPEIAALAANAPFYAGRDTRPGVGAAEDLPSCCRARASRRRSRAGTSSPRALRWGARAGRACPTRAVVVGAAARTRATGRSRCACPTRRRRSPTAPAVAAFVHASWPGWPSATTPASAARRRRPGASRRTAGRPPPRRRGRRWPTS